MNFNNQYRPGGFGHLPVVTKNIIIVSVIMFAATFLLAQRDINLIAMFGLHHHLASDFKPHQFITYIFMHGGIAHIAFNMFGVFIFGQVLEQTWGPKRYLIFYVLCGLGAAALHYIILHYRISSDLQEINDVLTRDLSVAERAKLIELKSDYLNSNVIVGASGSLFGLLGAFGMLYPNRELYIYMLFPIKAKWLVILYGLAELTSGLSNNPKDNVAHFAHLGGLIAGIIIVLIWRKRRDYFY